MMVHMELASGVLCLGLRPRALQVFGRWRDGSGLSIRLRRPGQAGPSGLIAAVVVGAAPHA